MPLYGGIEAGGTKFVCGIGTDQGQLVVVEQFPTTTPKETIGRAIAFFKEQANQRNPLTAIGIASFGPIDPDPNSPTFGCITSTPKTGWRHTAFAGPLKKELKIPVGFDTDVNAAALGENKWGAAKGLDTFIYLTVGTGIGGGAMVNGKLVHGLIHPEMGHIRIPHDFENDPFKGICPFHEDCLEGLATGPAIENRWEQCAEDLPQAHPAWHLEARYLSLGLVNLICILSPQRIILGGGVMQQSHLFIMIRKNIQNLLNGYIEHPVILHKIDDYIVPPQLGKNAGVLGAIALARETSN